MKRKLYLMVALLVALAVTGASFAYTATSVSVSTTITETTFASVTTTVPTNWTAKHGAAPSWTPIVGTAGSIGNGDLYYIDTRGYTGSILVMLYLANPAELARTYSYLNMGVNVWKTDGKTWEEETEVTGKAPDNLNYFLTLSNGYVSFILPAGKYAITIDVGSWYCIDTTEDDGKSLNPRFFIDVRQAY